MLTEKVSVKVTALSPTFTLVSEDRLMIFDSLIGEVNESGGVLTFFIPAKLD